MQFDDIKDINNGKLFYVDSNRIEKEIDLQESANCWWDLHHKNNVLEIIFQKKRKNIYVGEKRFFIGDMSYIEFYQGDERIRFELYIAESLDEYKINREIWENINKKLHKQGFWLFDNN